MRVWISFPGGSPNVPQQLVAHGLKLFHPALNSLEPPPGKEIHTIPSVMQGMSQCYLIKEKMFYFSTGISKMRISILVQSAESTSGVSPR